MRLSSVFKKPVAAKRSTNISASKAPRGNAQNSEKIRTARTKKTNKKKNARTIKVYAGYVRVATIALSVAILTVIWCLGYPQQAYENSSF